MHVNFFTTLPRPSQAGVLSKQLNVSLSNENWTTAYRRQLSGT